MKKNLTIHVQTAIIAMAVAAVTVATPVIAGVVADFAKNSDKVDGRHAVAPSATPSGRAGKLVATDSAGRLPNNIIVKAPDSDRVGGRQAVPYSVTPAQRAGKLVAADGAGMLPNNIIVKALNSDKLAGQPLADVASSVTNTVPAGSAALGTGTTIVHGLTLPPGKYFVTGRVVIGNPTDWIVDAYCGLGVKGTMKDSSYNTIIYGLPEDPSYATFSMQFVHESTETKTVDLFCSPMGLSGTFAAKRNIAATKVNSITAPVSAPSSVSAFPSQSKYETPPRP